ncbi:MAG: phosphoenolpyruvate synthase [Caldilineaceae bacterium]|nr:phosphoenolpyruvate synthase [Caldilineaceae bacterium]
MSATVLAFQAIDNTKRDLVGGKGANLGELSRIEGIRVPDGFCVSTDAFKAVVAATPSLSELLQRLSALSVEDRRQIDELSAALRGAIEAGPIPQAIRAEIIAHLARLGARDAYAVRSSATAEDLPAASFAGQYDTYLNVLGEDAILTHISKCWASLFSARAVIYRLQNDIDPRQVLPAVVVQKMADPQAAGVLFTADPVTSNRTVSSIDAGFGLGEALVSGLVNADVYKVRDGKVIDRRIAAKKLAIDAAEAGGTETREIEPAQQNRPALTDEQILRLAGIGRRIEAHFGSPQDIEWCLVDAEFYVVQSRPITTLYPIPEAPDQENHLYISVGHQQMMTDAMKPLGISVWQLTAGRPMYQAGGRLFVDVAPDLASPARREVLVNVLGKSDPLIRSALLAVLARGDWIKTQPDEMQQPNSGGANPGAARAGFQTLGDYDAQTVSELIARNQASIEELRRAIQTQSGPGLLDFIREDIGKLRQSLADPQSFGVIMTAMNAASWVNEKMADWLGEKNAADTLSRSVPNNITAEMGLDLLAVADVIRPYPDVIDYLQHAQDAGFEDGLTPLNGGPQASAAISAFLHKYGMRCAGEIDITRPRWREEPTTLVPMILADIRNVAPDAGRLQFEQGHRQALDKEQELPARLKRLPDGEQKAAETKRMIDRIRNLSGYREYPKYGIVSRYFIYKQALLQEAQRLVQAKVLRAPEEIYYLTFDELQEVVRTRRLDPGIISRRKADYALYAKLTPPRVMTSDGEIIRGAYGREKLPAGALAGLPVSTGVVEGRARVVVKLEDADLCEGDILVTAFTDPSWTPLFVSLKGLVTEVGGLMTHGAVIAREYGLPAVVGVENATRLIRDGQRIRVNGTDGYVEILTRRNPPG